MIYKARFRNFKSLRDVTVGLERLTVFVGPNGSGKSSMLQGLDLLCRSFQESNANADGMFLASRSRGTDGPVELTSELDDDHAYRYRTKDPAPSSKWAGDGRSIATTYESEDWKPWKLEPQVGNPLPRSVLLQLEPAKLAQPTPMTGAGMSPDGGGLHMALANMALNDPELWLDLQQHFKKILPNVRRLRHTKSGQPALLFDMAGTDSLKADQVSEGTLLVLGLITAFYSPDRPNLILLDDLDRGLHPKAQNELVSLLRVFLELNIRMQIVATTHSPYLLNYLQPEEVRMTLLKDDGTTACAALSSHEDFNTWKDEMAPGEMWSLFGEKWLANKETAK